METMPRRGIHSLRAELLRNEELALALDGDWFIHMDADEFRLSPWPGLNLAQALEPVDRAGYNSSASLDASQSWPVHDVGQLDMMHEYSAAQPNASRAKDRP
jgi:hypothetical protein